MPERSRSRGVYGVVRRFFEGKKTSLEVQLNTRHHFPRSVLREHGLSAFSLQQTLQSRGCFTHLPLKLLEPGLNVDTENWEVRSWKGAPQQKDSQQPCPPGCLLPSCVPKISPSCPALACERSQYFSPILRRAGLLTRPFTLKPTASGLSGSHST